jgi:outer membrane protein
MHATAPFDLGRPGPDPHRKRSQQRLSTGLGDLVRQTLAGACALCVSVAAPAEDLYEIYELALGNDPEFLAAGAANRAAQELRPQARAGLLPNFGLQGDTFGNEQDLREANLATSVGRRNFNSSSIGVQLRQPLYRMDRWIALDQATNNVSAADAEFEFARQSLMLRVAQRYFNVLRAQDTLTFALAEQEAFAQQLEQSQQRFEVGLIAITDVEEAKAGADLSRARVIQAENALDNAREALREVTGRYHEVLKGLGEEMPLALPEPADIDAWTENALQQSLQIKQQSINTQTAKLEIKRQEAGHLPTVDLVGDHFRSKGGSSALSRTTSWTSRIGLELAVPIYSGGSVVSRTRESRHQYQQTLDQLEQIRRSVQRQTRDSFLGIASGISRVDALAQAVTSTRAAVEAIEAGFQVGTRTTVDVLNAQRNLFEAKRDYADARYTYVVDILTLRQASGSLREENLQLINTWLE